MASKLTKAKLFFKKYGIYILLAVVTIFAIVFAMLGGGKDNFWFKIVNELMALLKKTQKQLQDIYKEGQEKEDVIRHDKVKEDTVINDNAVKEQEQNLNDLKNDATTILQDTKDDPEKMGDAFSNAFGIPKGNNNQ